MECHLQEITQDTEQKMSEEMRILKMIEDGEVSPEEGAMMLKELGSQPAQSESETTVMSLLEQIENGDLSPDEGIEKLNKGSVGQTVEENYSDDEDEPASPPQISDEELERWKNWWQIPMYVGVGIVVLSTLWLNSAYQNSGYGFWFFCSWLPLALGVLLISLSWMSQKGPWIHVRVRGKRDNVAISMPAPLRLSGWGLRTFGHYIPNLDSTSVDEIISALDQTAKSDAPLYIHVDEEDGEHVEVFIG
jgi:hypothetical protein